MTGAESLLWERLRQRRLAGLRFRRQHAIGPVVLDFYCPAHKLAVEVDGGIHDQPGQAEKDAERTRFLSGLGIHVLRVRNEEVLSNLDSVFDRILLATQAPRNKSAPSCSPPSLAGEGPGVGGTAADATTKADE